MGKKLLVAILVLMMMFVMAGCGKNRVALTKNEFIKEMEDKDFETADATGQFGTDVVDSVTIALNDNYQIEFYVLHSVDEAVSAFNQNQSTFESYKGNTSMESSASINNYSFYSLTTGENFYYVSRTDETFIYVNVPAEYKDEVKDIVKDLGY